MQADIRSASVVEFASEIGQFARTLKAAIVIEIDIDLNGASVGHQRRDGDRHQRPGVGRGDFQIDRGIGVILSQSRKA